jgi:Na+/phosphate symporter
MMRQNVDRALWLGMLIFIIGILWPIQGSLRLISLPLLIIGFGLLIVSYVKSHHDKKP